MYGKVVNLKFANMEEAKLAASFFTENIASKIKTKLEIIGNRTCENTNQSKVSLYNRRHLQQVLMKMLFFY